MVFCLWFFAVLVFCHHPWFLFQIALLYLIDAGSCAVCGGGCSFSLEQAFILEDSVVTWHRNNFPWGSLFQSAGNFLQAVTG